MVCPHVRAQRLFLLVGACAELTLERALAAVRVLVLNHLVVVRERTTTHVTHVLLDAQMTPHVHVQLTDDLEHLRTKVTLVLPDVAVRADHVLGKAGWLRAAVAAARARERLLASVRAHVQLQAGRHAERAPAVLAHERAPVDAAARAVHAQVTQLLELAPTLLALVARGDSCRRIVRRADRDTARHATTTANLVTTAV